MLCVTVLLSCSLTSMLHYHMYLWYHSLLRRQDEDLNVKLSFYTYNGSTCKSVCKCAGGFIKQYVAEPIQ